MESLDDGDGSSANSRSLSRPLFDVLVMHRGDRMEASSDPHSLPVRVKRGRCSTGGSHGKGKEQFDRGETVFFSLPILVNCSARTINVIVFNCLRRMSVTFKMVSRGDKSWRASWAWSPPVVESVARLATLETGPPVSTSRAALLARISRRYRL